MNKITGIAPAMENGNARVVLYYGIRIGQDFTLGFSFELNMCIFNKENKMSIEDEERKLVYVSTDGQKNYYLEKPTNAIRIQVLRLKEFLEKKSGIVFVDQ